VDNNLTSPKVSVIMPAYNVENYISDAIQSVIAQTYCNWELIIIDDGSKDSTSKVAAEWQIKDNRIQYYYQDNGKQGKARNLGISKSTGIYLAFLDADDLWMPEKLEIQVLTIQEKNVDLIFANSYIFNDHEVNDISKKTNISAPVFYTISDLTFFLEANRIPILTVLVKREKVININGFSEDLVIQNVEDYHLWLKLLMSNCRFYSLGDVLAKYREHENSATSKDRIVMHKIPAAFFDLSQLYPECKKQILQQLKSKFNSIYKNGLFTKSEMALYIKKNLKYLSKSKVNYIYLLLNFVLPTKVTKRLLIYILNT
jgi:teichuronic acid biosynthesis glycosyltransferase TuaG